ncbi:MAG: Gfo/Idh/MocA family protein [Planctomycetota bacterium]|jgi:predicted dehydrogenase
MRSEKHLSRRNFLKTVGKGATALGAMSVSAPAVLRAKSPNEIVNVGCIGIGVRGGSLVKYLGRLDTAKIVAVCDVYKPHLQKGVERCNNPDVRTYLDYRELLADKNVDAVVIATPDFRHAAMVLDAIAAKKDIYVEKGWCRTVDEAKVMYAAVKKSDIVMQLGHQGRQIRASLQAAELVKEGVLGPVTLVRTGRFTNTSVGQNFWRWYGWYSDFRRPDPAQVKKDLDWERWLGDAPKVPFSMEHFWHWRCYWNYGTGVAGDLLSHEFDFVQSVLGYGIPDTCVCLGQNNLLKDGREVPDTWSTIYGYEEQGCTFTFQASMNTRQLRQPVELRGKEALLRFDDIGHDIEKFEVYAESSSQKYAAKIKSKEISTREPFLRYDPAKTPAQPSHMEDFLNCVRTRGKPKCNEDEAFVEAVTCAMSVEAYQQKRQARWDPVKQQIV